jgi:hypothetical protein
VRQTAAAYVRSILNDPAITVYPQSERSFLSGLALYEARHDKGYSHAACVSMQALRQHGITEVLTDDDNFTQEGFIKLL